MCSDKPVSLRVVLGLSLALAVLPTLGCGKKGEPLPPLRTIPLPTTDLSVYQQGRLILFDLGYPSTTLSGLPLGGIDTLELHAMTKPLATDPGAAWPSAEPAEFEAAGKLLQRFSGADLQSAVAGDRLQFQLPLASPLPNPPLATIYAVRSTKAGEKSGYSNRVTLVAREPMSPPKGLAVDAQADGIHLRWESEEGAQGFDIFRRDAQNKSYGQAIARVPGGERVFVDQTASFGNKYIYTVRAVANANPLVHSDPAGEREVGYEDRYPPPVPGNILALGERGTVRLRWDASPGADVAGYLIWRKDPGRDFSKLTATPLSATEFTDRGLASGLTFEYVLQAVDKSGNESPRSAPVSVVTR